MAPGIFFTDLYPVLLYNVVAGSVQPVYSDVSFI